MKANVPVKKFSVMSLSCVLPCTLLALKCYNDFCDYYHDVVQNCMKYNFLGAIFGDKNEQLIMRNVHLGTAH